MPLGILTALLLYLPVLQAAGQTVIIGEREVLYSPARLKNVPCIERTLLVPNGKKRWGIGFAGFLPVIIKKDEMVDGGFHFTMDASLSTLAAGGSEMRFLYSSPHGQNWFRGPLDDPLKTMVSQKKAQKVWKNGRSSFDSGFAYASAYIPNLYKIETGKLLGFVHVERYNESTGAQPDRRYYIGTAYSSDNGATWRYCGDILAPYYDKIGDVWTTDTSKIFYSNIGGIPYLVVPHGDEPYFYVYFNEHLDNSSLPKTAVARAMAADVVASAERGRASQWYKYYNGAWDQPGMGGRSSHILSGKGHFDDMHSDAAYCSGNRRYFLTSNQAMTKGTKTLVHLALHSSPDGISWIQEAVVEDDDDQVCYSCFVSLPPESAAGDGHEVGREFSLIYALKKRLSDTDWDYYDERLCRRKITVQTGPR
jgi:hypothetical protein